MVPRTRCSTRQEGRALTRETDVTTSPRSEVAGRQPRLLLPWLGKDVLDAQGLQGQCPRVTPRHARMTTNTKGYQSCASARGSCLAVQWLFVPGQFLTGCYNGICVWAEHFSAGNVVDSGALLTAVEDGDGRTYGLEVTDEGVFHCF